MCSHRFPVPEPPGRDKKVLGSRALFAETAWLTRNEVAEILGALEQLARELASRLLVPGFERLTNSIASGLGRGPLRGPVGLSKDVVLDLAAELLSLADALRSEGCYASVFALEGIEARLIAALIATVPQAGACDEADVPAPLARPEPRPAGQEDGRPGSPGPPCGNEFGQAIHAWRGASRRGQHPPQRAGRRH